MFINQSNVFVHSNHVHKLYASLPSYEALVPSLQLLSISWAKFRTLVKSHGGFKRLRLFLKGDYKTELVYPWVLLGLSFLLELVLAGECATGFPSSVNCFPDFWELWEDDFGWWWGVECPVVALSHL